MKNFQKPLLFITVSALIFFIINESFSYFHNLEQEKKSTYDKDKLILNNLTDAQAKNVEILAEVLASDENVINAYLKNDPELIKQKVAPLWEIVKKKKITYEIHFFQPPAISFVNFSNFKSLGKDVSSVRTDILWVTSSFKPSSHALMCKTYAGFRATHPIYDKNGTMLGGLSLGKKVDWIPDAIKEKTTHDSFLVYTKESTQSLAPKYYADFMKDKTPVGDYILADRTFHIQKTDIAKIDFSQKMQDVTINNEEFILYSYPIIDFNDNTMGYVCTVSQLQEFKDHFLSSLLKSFLIIVLTVFLILFITRKQISKILKEIDFLKNITLKIKNRDFTSLHSYSTTAQISTESLSELQTNILEMGEELSQRYTFLEDENKQKEKQLIEQLYTDELTGLSNRNALARDLEIHNKSFIALFNIKSFKEINDAFGFETANYILKELANRYEPYAKKYGYKVYRVGSDEYVILQTSSKDKQEFKKFILEMLTKVEHSVFNIKHIDINIHITMYAGICFDAEQKLEKAGMALKQAKKLQKDFIIYSPKENTQEVHLNNIATINKLSKALENDNVLVYYQDIVDRNGITHKYEALVRMRDGEKILSPFFFLEIAKRTKYYTSITRTVVEKTFNQFKNTKNAFSINLSADDILNEEIIELINRHMKSSKDTSRVIFELIESDDLYNLSEIATFIKNTKKMGAKIAIDDFGTGYSNFSYMMKIEPDYLKIDGSLIKDLDTDINARKIVATITSFASQLNIKTIAEYVHSQEVFEICKELGVDEFQGYYFAEPHEIN